VFWSGLGMAAEGQPQVAAGGGEQPLPRPQREEEHQPQPTEQTHTAAEPPVATWEGRADKEDDFDDEEVGPSYHTHTTPPSLDPSRVCVCVCVCALFSSLFLISLSLCVEDMWAVAGASIALCGAGTGGPTRGRNTAGDERRLRRHQPARARLGGQTLHL
jgi:hypothetical protein